MGSRFSSVEVILRSFSFDIEWKMRDSGTRCISHSAIEREIKGCGVCIR